MKHRRSEFVGGERVTLTDYGATGMGLPRATVLIVLSITDQGFMDSIAARPSDSGWIHAIDPATGHVWLLDLDADVDRVIASRAPNLVAISLTCEQARGLLSCFIALPTHAHGARAACAAIRAQLASVDRSVRR